MKNKRLILINPVNPKRTGLTVNRSSRFPPIGLGIIAALTPESWEVELVDENWEPFIYRKADLVGITAFTAAATRAYEISAIYRKRGVPVIMGGIHASMCSQEALQFVDSVVIGEAEAVWPKVVADVEADQLQQVYQGKWMNLEGLPYPRRDIFHPDYMFASIQTSRGCPMDCEFCSVTAFNGKRYRRRPPEEVLDELETIPQKMIFFVDDNIIGYGKESLEKALAIFRGMVERKLDKWWFCQASINFADDKEVLYWASRAGCKMVFLGLEAEDVDSLIEVNKRLNLKRGVESYKEAFQHIHRAGIAVLGAFIYGMDGDTKKKLHHRTEYIIHSGVDVMQTTYLTPLPGTRLFNKLRDEKRLLYTNFPTDWEHYDMAEVIYRPLSMGQQELVDEMSESNRRLYSHRSIWCKFTKTLCATRSFTTAMWAKSSNINYCNVALGRENSNYRR